MSDTRLYQSIASRIRDLIDAGDFPPGARLPGERDLAERFGVSRMTIREAEIALEAQGLISIRTGSGVYVCSNSAALTDALPDVSAFDLTAARAVIEAEAAALASKVITSDEIEHLERLVIAMSDPLASDDEAAQADRDFHLTIARIAGNPVIEHCIRLIWRMREELPRVKHVYARVCHNDLNVRNKEHGDILSALKDRDAQASRLAMRDHFHRLFEAMLEATEEDALAEVRRRTAEDRQRFLATTQI